MIVTVQFRDAGAVSNELGWFFVEQFGDLIVFVGRIRSFVLVIMRWPVVLVLAKEIVGHFIQQLIADDLSIVTREGVIIAAAAPLVVEHRSGK